MNRTLLDADGNRWISPLTHLGRSMGELKTLVRERMGSPLVTEPLGPNLNWREPPPSQSSGSPAEGEEDEDGRIYMKPEAWKLEGSDIVNVGGGDESEYLQHGEEEIKWSKSDKACEAAVAFVGGADFFELGDGKAKKKKKGEEGEEPVVASLKKVKLEVEPTGPDADEDVDEFLNEAVDFNLLEGGFDRLQLNLDPQPEPGTSATFLSSQRDSQPCSSGAEANGDPLSAGAEETEERENVSNFDRCMNRLFQQSKMRNEAIWNIVKPGMMTKLGLSEMDIRYTRRITSANLASVKGEIFQDNPVMESSVMPPLGLIPESTNLKSLAFLKILEDESGDALRRIPPNLEQYFSEDFKNHEYLKRMQEQEAVLADPRIKQEHELVDKEEDFLVHVLVYQPMDTYNVQLPDDVTTPCEPTLAYEVRLLGSQTVRELMEAIHCENDFAYMKDVPHPDKFVEDPNEFAAIKFPSRLMLIHDTIYCTPYDNALEHRSLINYWIRRSPNKKMGPFKNGNWDVKLSELELQFGFPYVYIHLGDCEHLVVFTKARLLSLEDNHLLKDYPKLHGMPEFKNIYCRVDNTCLASWAVVGYKEFAENPMLLCSECVKMYCFHKNKKKQGDFKLYPLTQMASLI